MTLLYKHLIEKLIMMLTLTPRNHALGFRLKLQVSFKSGPHSRADLFQGFTLFHVIPTKILVPRMCVLSMLEMLMVETLPSTL